MAISTCGNFALLGDTTGRIDKYNIQSGKSRGAFIGKRPLSFYCRISHQQKKKNTTMNSGHTKAIQGLSTDFLNKTLVSASLDGTVRVCVKTIKRRLTYAQLVAATVVGLQKMHIVAQHRSGNSHNANAAEPRFLVARNNHR